MDAQSIASAAGLALLATGNVGLWTLRVAVAAAGRRVTAAAIAGVEALLFAMVFGAVISSLDDPLRVAAYSVGVAAGTLIGVVADEWLSTGQTLVRAVIDGDGSDAACALRRRGWPATMTRADGVRGPVAVLLVAVDDRQVRRLRHDIDAVTAEAFVTVERLRDTRPIPLPDGLHQAGQGGRRGVRRRAGSAKASDLASG